jgi:predicted dithiol-disulfide oxidoreductase (DUF899 family)
VKVEKNYIFDTATGKQTLADLFGDKSQLIVTHFMLGPDWEQGCIGCSFGADHYDGIQPIDIDELAGTSMFYRDAAGNIFHTYSAYARGSELVGGAYGYLDHLPKGRNETGPGYNLGDWVRHHDRYEANG